MSSKVLITKVDTSLLFDSRREPAERAAFAVVRLHHEAEFVEVDLSAAVLVDVVHEGLDPRVAHFLADLEEELLEFVLVDAALDGGDLKLGTGGCSRRSPPARSL